MPGAPLTRQSKAILEEMEGLEDWWHDQLDRIACGTPLAEVFADVSVLYGVGRRWVDSDETRKAEFAAAERYFAESRAYGTLGTAEQATPEDVAVAKLKIDTNWRLISKLDRQRWGEKEQGALAGGVTVNLIQFSEAQILAGAPGRVFQGIAAVPESVVVPPPLTSLGPEPAPAATTRAVSPI